MTVVHIAEVPDSISRETVRKILALLDLDLDPSTTEGVEILPEGIIVTQALSRVPIEDRDPEMGSLYTDRPHYAVVAPVTTAVRIPIAPEGSW